MSSRRRKRRLLLLYWCRKVRQTIYANLLQLWDSVSLWWLPALYGVGMVLLFYFIALRLMDSDLRMKMLEQQIEELRLEPAKPLRKSNK